MKKEVCPTATTAPGHCSSSEPGIGPGVTGSAGKSSSMRSPANAARSGPLRVWKVSGTAPSTVPPSRSAWAAASVAWPHRSISVAGENQRSPKEAASSPGTR